MVWKSDKQKNQKEESNPRILKKELKLRILMKETQTITKMKLTQIRKIHTVEPSKHTRT